jgi:hypothetical protein
MSSYRAATAQILAVLEQLRIPHAIGGSIASSIHSIARQSHGVDIAIALDKTQAPALHQALVAQFCIDDLAIVDAITYGRSFNAIHLASGLKFDFFIAAQHPLGPQEISRAQYIDTDLLGQAPLRLPIVSPEDILLAKLLWYRDGGQTSERQWNDLRHLARIQGPTLDRAYLDAQLSRLQLNSLSHQLFAEVASPKLDTV